jgi:FAD/FMN-containing dehydrogenase
MTDPIRRTLRRLRQELAGRVSLPGESRYLSATTIWARPTGPMPRAVAHCRSPEDVQAAIRAARSSGLQLSVRGGGHDWAGRALCEGLVIDLSDMRSVAVGSDARTGRVAGGARMSDVLGVTDPLGLAVVAGSVGAVGMTGFTLGGGYGALIGRFGLALDNIVAAEVVLADGRIVLTDRNHDEELFWALRGGGGNFGVVTALQHRLHVLPSVHTGMLLFPFAEARAILKNYADIAASAPDELTAQLGFAIGPDGVPVIMIVPTWCGAPEEGEKQTAPFLRLGTLLAGGVQAVPYGASLTLFDPYLVNGQREIMETCWLRELTSDGIEALIGAIDSAVSPGCAIFTHEFRGAATRVPVDGTAFGLRRNHVLLEILATVRNGSGEMAEIRHQQWVRATLHAFDRMALPGGYPNLLAPGDLARASRSYGPNAEGLLRVKGRYDPDNVFSSAIPLPIARHNPSSRRAAPSKR